MKHLLILAITLSNTWAYAECITSVNEVSEQQTQVSNAETPAHLKGATITVTLADGSTTTVPAEKFKVVPRKQEWRITKVETSTSRLCSASKNRISGLAGRGPVRTLRSTNYGSYVSVETETGTVLGAQYQRLITERVSVGLQATDNGSGLLTLGLDF